jgi:hypothetical protein
VQLDFGMLAILIKFNVRFEIWSVVCNWLVEDRKFFTYLKPTYDRAAWSIASALDIIESSGMRAINVHNTSSATAISRPYIQANTKE